jgi:hypothetical protein
VASGFTGWGRPTVAVRPTVYRSGNWWEKPLPATPPVHPSNDLFLQELNGKYNGAGTDGTFATAATNSSGNQYMLFTGGVNTTLTTFDTPIYRVTSADTSYILTKLAGANFVPAEFLTGGPGLRIPELAKTYFLLGGAQSNDSPMLIYDEERGYYANLASTYWNASTTRWEVTNTGAASISYLSSYGFDSNSAQVRNNLPTQWDPSLAFYQDQLLNHGFRGNNPMTRVIDYDRMMAEGGVKYVTETFAVRTGPDLRFPMIGFENNKGGLIPEGTRLHIKSSVTDAQILSRLSADGLSGTALAQAATIVRALRDYGTYLGDNSGSGSRIKLQNFAREGRTNPWVIDVSAIRVFDFRANGDWEFIADNYDPPLS